MAETRIIKDPRLEPFFMKVNKGGYSVYKKAMLQPLDKTKPSYPGERFVGECKNIEAAIKFIIEKKMIANQKNVNGLIEYYMALRTLTEEIRKVFDIDYEKDIAELKAQIKLLKTQVESLLNK